MVNSEFHVLVTAKIFQKYSICYGYAAISANAQYLSVIADIGLMLFLLLLQFLLSSQVTLVIIV